MCHGHHGSLWRSRDEVLGLDWWASGVWEFRKVKLRWEQEFREGQRIRQEKLEALRQLQESPSRIPRRRRVLQYL